MTLKYDYYNMLECESCALIFDEGEAETVVDDLGRRAMVCPNCGSGDLVDYYPD